MTRNILIIDNDTEALKDIKEALKNEKFKIINFKKFKRKQAEEFTHIILTGGDYWANLKKFSEEVKLIKDPPVPILGICFGMQLIGKVFGSSLKHLDEMKTGNKTVRILKKDVLFQGMPKNISVFGYHGYALNKIGKNLKIIADSEDCVEAIKHKSLPLWGVQFHPEVKIQGKGDGRRIIKKFLNL